MNDLLMFFILSSICTNLFQDLKIDCKYHVFTEYEKISVKDLFIYCFSFFFPGEYVDCFILVF